MVDKRDRWIFSGLLVVIITLLVLDAWEDLSHGASLSHILEETVLVAICLGGLVYLWRRYFRFKTENIHMRREVGRLRDDLAAYKRETAHLIEELSARIESQLRSWGLTEAEQSVCMLALKGLSTKEIATARATAEKTISQQLTSIYGKSGLRGRAELAAFFLEDLMERPKP